MRIRVIAKGIWGAGGELPIGAELTVSGQIPPGWVKLVEIVDDAPADAAPIINPRKRKG